MRTAQPTSKISWNGKRAPRALREANRRLTRAVFDYHRVGFDRRSMTFRKDGTVGQGARARELFWNCKTVGRKVTLEIRSQTGLTCRLVEDRDKVWRGQWLCCEKMPVELSPIGRLPTISNRRSAARECQPESLFVLSLPRSLSTLLYHAARKTMNLREPAWTSDGEILNADRYALQQGPVHDSSRKFISSQSELQTFYAATEFLDQTVQTHGYAYKDVVHPFVMAEWIQRRKIKTVIWIRRDIADVAYAMLRRRWHYPAHLFPEEKKVERAIVRGLIAADCALASIRAQCIDFEQVIHDEMALQTALKALYPDKRVQPVSYIDNRFKRARKEILERRKTSLHRRLTDYVTQCSTAAPSRESPTGCRDGEKSGVEAGTSGAGIT